MLSGVARGARRAVPRTPGMAIEETLPEPIYQRTIEAKSEQDSRTSPPRDTFACVHARPTSTKLRFSMLNCKSVVRLSPLSLIT